MLRIIESMVFGLAGLLLASPVFAHGISAADKQSMLDGGYLKYVSLGASHMVTGYDHLLFLFGVIFFLTKFWDIVRFITAFTLGHSITLIFATFLQITANYYLVDAVIALTVFYKGFDNVGGFQKYLGTKSPNLIRLVFLFGLIHGFGLSTRLQQLPLGDGGLLARIISFNIGVELGQIAALSVMLLILAGWRATDSFRRFSTAANCGIMTAGVLLFLMQMHGFTHDVFVDDLAFSIDSHQHAHVKKKEARGAVRLSELHSHGGGPMHRDVLAGSERSMVSQSDEPSEWGAASQESARLDEDLPSEKSKKKPVHSHGGKAHSH